MRLAEARQSESSSFLSTRKKVSLTESSVIVRFRWKKTSLAPRSRLFNASAVRALTHRLDERRRKDDDLSTWSFDL